MILQEKWLEQYFEDCEKGRGLSAHSLKAYKTDLKQFQKEMDDFKKEIDKESLKEFIRLLHYTYKPKSAKRKLASVKAFFRYLVFEDIIESNPFEKIRVDYREPKTLPKTIERRTISAIYKLIEKDLENSKTQYQRTLNLRNLLVINMLISTGMRVSELCSIKLENVNLRNRTILIEGKGKKERMLHISSTDTVQLIDSYLKCVGRKSMFLFQSMKGEVLDANSIRHLLKKYSKEVRLSKILTPHQFRHTFATMLLEQDVDIRIIQKILGHSSINTTAIYADVAQAKIKQVMTKKNPIIRI